MAIMEYMSASRIVPISLLFLITGGMANAGGFPYYSAGAVSEGLREIDHRMELRLEGLDAGPIDPVPGLDEAYQFLEVPGSHLATSLRLERHGETVTLIARRHDQRDLYLQLSTEEWREVRLALTAADVWSMPREDASAPRVLEAVDDYLEAFWGDDAHSLHRQSSDLGPALTDVRRQLFELTGWPEAPLDPDAVVR